LYLTFYGVQAEYLYTGAIAFRRVHVVAKSSCHLLLLCPPVSLFICIGATFFRVDFREILLYWGLW